ncbi:MAG: glycosyltransferase [Methylotenera sp.]|nr:glycosyltransferase [Methylotenera sp.]
MSKHTYLYLKNYPNTGLPIVTGTIKAVHGLASGLTTCGVNVTVICEGKQNSSVKTVSGYEIRCFDRSEVTSPFSIPKQLKFFLANITKDNSLVILNGIFNPAIYGVARFLNVQSINYILAPHGMYHPETFKKNSFLKWPYWFCCERYILNHAKAIQLLDINGSKYLEKLGIKTPIISVPNGFFDKDVISAEKLEWRSDGIVKILFFGRIDIHTKALDVLIEAISVLRKSVNFELTIQGPDWGDEKSKLVKLVKKFNVEDVVKFAEPEYDMPASEVISKYDIFCMPSRHEGFGLSALEAMLAARVLLVSSSTGIATHVSNSGCGVVIEPNVVSITEGFKSLIGKKSSWKSMGLAGREYALNALHWDKIAKNALVEYTGLC